MSKMNPWLCSNIRPKKVPPQTGIKRHSSGRRSKDNNDAADSANSRGQPITNPISHDPDLPAHYTRKLKTGLVPEEQKLFRGNKEEDGENLNMTVKDNSTVMLLEDPKSKERNVEELNEKLSDAGVDGVESNEMSTDAGEFGVESIEMSAIAGVRAEVDRLSDRVVALKADVSCGTKVSNKEFTVSTELLIRQLLKLDNIEAEGEARVQRKDEVRRVQDLMDTLDILKAMNSDPSKHNSNDMTSQNNNSVTSQNSNGFASQNGNVDSGVDGLDTPDTLKARNSDPGKTNSNDMTSENNNSVTSQNSNGVASQNGNVDSGVDDLDTPDTLKVRNSDPSKNNSNDMTSQKNNSVTSQNRRCFSKWQC